MTCDLGYVKLDAARWRGIDRWLEGYGEPYEGWRVLPKPTASQRVRQQYAAERKRVREAVK